MARPAHLVDLAIIQLAEEMIAAGYETLAGDGEAGVTGERRRQLNAASDYLRALLANVRSGPPPTRQGPALAFTPCIGVVRGNRVRCVSFADVEVLHVTDRAILVVLGDEEHWIAKSQLAEGVELSMEKTPGRLVVSRWLAEKDRLI